MQIPSIADIIAFVKIQIVGKFSSSQKHDNEVGEIFLVMLILIGWGVVYENAVGTHKRD